MRCGHHITRLELDWAEYYRTQYDATLTDGGADELVTTKDGSTVFRTDHDFALYREAVLDHTSRDASILEFGAGHGRIVSRTIAAGFQNVTAFDVGERYGESLRAHLPAGQVFIGERPMGQYDVIVTFFVLEHDVDPKGSLTYMRSVAKPGATLYVVVPNFARNAADLACADHVQHFHPDRLVALLREVGFEPARVDTDSSIGATIVTARAATPDASEPTWEALREKAREAAQPYLALRSRMVERTQALAGERGIYLYGAGFYGTLAASMLEGVEIRGVFDQNPRKAGLPRLGTRVAAPPGPEARFEEPLLVCLNPEIGPMVAARYGASFPRVLSL
jgi:SAM-dependent methyltransferase